MTMAKADILIVEDHPTMREAMRLILEHEGFDIRDAPDGQVALAMVASKSFAKRRFRLSQARVRSTTQRRGSS